MSKAAKVLVFPRPAVTAWSPEEASAFASEYLDASEAERSTRDVFDADILMALCSNLRRKVNVDPGLVFKESSSLFERVRMSDRDAVGVFDEREYILGELALVSAKACRLLGKRADTEQWLDRADASFRQTVNPSPHLSNVAYDRLALQYEVRNFPHVLEHTLPLARTFDQLGMVVESAKTLYLRAATLKLTGDWHEAFEISRTLTTAIGLEAEPGILAQAWMEIGEYHAHSEDYAEANKAYSKALPLLERANRPIAVFSLKLSIGETLRSQSSLSEALAFFRSACADARVLGLTTNLAYAHLLASETLLAMARHREAEWEIYAALPIIQEESMVPEGLAALNLLRESVSRRKADPAAIKTLRSFLQN